MSKFNPTEETVDKILMWACSKPEIPRPPDPPPPSPLTTMVTIANPGIAPYVLSRKLRKATAHRELLEEWEREVKRVGYPEAAYHQFEAEYRIWPPFTPARWSREYARWSHEYLILTLAPSLRERFVYITESGWNRVTKLTRLRNDRSERLRYSSNTVIKWLFESARAGEEVDPMLFLKSDAAYFAGQLLSHEEIQETLEYLANRDLLAFTRSGARVVIRSEGANLVISGGLVSDHTENKKSTTVNHNYNNYNSHGNMQGEINNSTQINLQGVDSSKFLALADYVLNQSTALGLPEQRRVELERLAGELNEEASSETAEPGRLRHLTRQIKEALVVMGTTSAATAGVALAEGALSSIL